MTSYTHLQVELSFKNYFIAVKF